MINFYGKLTKIMIIVLTTASKFLLIKQNATWKASAQMAKKGQMPRPGKLSKNVKMTRMMTLLFLPRITTPTPPELVANTTKMLPQKSNNILPHLTLILPERRMMEAAMMNRNCKNHPTKKTPECTSVSATTHGEKKTNNTVIEKTDEIYMDNYGMFLDDAPINNLPRNLKPFIKNAIDTKLFSTVKFISCLADARNLMGLVFFEIKWHGNSMADKRERTLHWAARCEFITTRIADLRQYAYDR